MYCYRCGSEIQDGGRKCQICGASLCPEYGCKPCKNDVEFDITPKKVDAVAIVCGAIAALVAISFILTSAINFIRSAYVPKPKDIVTTGEIRAADVWYSDSPIEFTSYPAEISPGQWAELSIAGQPETEYSISVQCGARTLSTDRLWPITSDTSGNASWVWRMPENCPAGCYSITVFSSINERNLIDYAVLDRSGKVFGDRPEHRKPGESNDIDHSAISLDGDINAEAENMVQPPAENVATYTVYITDTGSKYHRAGCQYLEDSSTEIDLSDAEANGYSPCSVCNP